MPESAKPCSDSLLVEAAEAWIDNANRTSLARETVNFIFELSSGAKESSKKRVVVVVFFFLSFFFCFFVYILLNVRVNACIAFQIVSIQGMLHRFLLYPRTLYIYMILWQANTHIIETSTFTKMRCVYFHAGGKKLENSTMPINPYIAK